MRLTEWVKEETVRRAVTRRKVLEDLALVSQVSLQTLLGCDRGMRLGSYLKAKAVSEATAGKVSLAELCE